MIPGYRYRYPKYSHTEPITDTGFIPIFFIPIPIPGIGTWYRYRYHTGYRSISNQHVLGFGQRYGKMCYEIQKDISKKYSGTGPRVIVTLGPRAWELRVIYCGGLTLTALSKGIYSFG